MIRIKPEPTVTKSARPPVTKPAASNVTQGKAGRPKVHASPAERQRAYRERKKRVEMFHVEQSLGAAK